MNRKIISVIVFMMLFTSVIYGEENSNEVSLDVVVDEGIEMDVEVETDPEVLERIRLYEMRFKGTKEMSEELADSINISLTDNSMPIDIIINQRYLETDVDALLINDRTYVPFRAIVEAFNLTDVTWNNDLYKATFIAGDQEIELLINTPKVMVDGEEVLMDTPSLIIEGRTMVPIRFISEFLGFDVTWDNVYYTVGLVHDTYAVNEDKLGGRFYNVEEMKTFSKLVYREAGSVSYEAKHGVASVVMNRVESKELEDTVHDVIYEVNTNVQFPPAHKDNFQDTVPNKESVLAAKMALRGENSVGTCLYFNTSPFKGTTIYKVVDGVYFCYQ